MATKNIVPRANGEGSLGTKAKKWGAVYANDIFLADNETVVTKLDKQDEAITDKFTEQDKAIAGKLDKNQGAENVGKYFTIDENGDVVLVELKQGDGVPIGTIISYSGDLDNIPEGFQRQDDTHIVAIRDIPATELNPYIIENKGVIAQHSGEIAKKFGEDDFTIININSGNNIATNSSYVINNPFPSYHLQFEVEIQYNGNWYMTKDIDMTYYTGPQSFGVEAFDMNDGTIKIVTGITYLITSSNNWQPININLASAPARLKVWKVGKK